MVLFFSIGIWTAVPALPAGETWIHHVIIHYPGLVLFLILDAIILIAATTLTTLQASQVNEDFKFISTSFHQNGKNGEIDFYED